MRYPIFVAIAFAVLVCTIALATGGDHAGDQELVKALLGTAKHSPSLLVRAAALDTLSRLKTKDAGASNILKMGLLDLINNHDPKRDDKSLLPYVIQALASLGPSARDLIPRLVELKGSDAGVDLAVDAAIQSILTSSPVGAKTLKDLSADLKSALDPLKPATKEYVDSLTAILQEPKNGVSMRVMSAKALGMAGPDAKSAVGSLQKVQGEMDEDLKSVAVNAIKKIQGGK